MATIPRNTLDVTFASKQLDLLLEYIDARIKAHLEPDDLHSTLESMRAEKALRNFPAPIEEEGK